MALDRVTIDVPRGSRTVLIGPSGCGKSTLLRIIAGLSTPQSGVVRFGGEPLVRANLANVRSRLGYMIQEGGLFPHLRVSRNVGLAAQQAGWPPRRIAERIEALCALTQLPTALLSRFPDEISGGQRQRASLMRALMLDPEVLLLDEPLGALDPMVRYEIQQELRSVFARLGKTVLMVTHDISEAALLGETLVLMRAGRVVQQGPLRDLAESPAEDFVTEFISAQREPMRLAVESLA